jgi:asparagine synthase (glutamine-hydrolysing)
MIRYIAFSWNADDAGEREAAQLLLHRFAIFGSTWHRGLSRNDISVFYTGSRFGSSNAYELTNGGGVVIGTLFERDRDPHAYSVPHNVTFDERSSADIVGNSGRTLIEDYWGSYVAFILDPALRRCLIIRGPMSDLPCFYCSFRGVHIFFSWLEDCLALNLISLTVDWSFIALQVGFGHSARVGESAINEVQALGMGECLELDGHAAVRTMYWDPRSFASDDPFDDPRAATGALRATVMYCVHAWAAPHQSILHRLSGGFDSSVVLSCLRRLSRPLRVTCLNYYFPGAKADERNFARLIASHTGTELIERAFGLERKLSVIEGIRRTAAPIHDLVGWQEHPREKKLISDTGATAVFMGAMGDALFEKNTHLSAAADYLGVRGMSLGLWSVLRDVAEYQRVSVWKVLKRAIYDNWIDRPTTRWDYYEVRQREGILKRDSFLAPDAMKEELSKNMDRLLHPWLRSVEGVPIGKLWLLAGLTSEGYYETHFRDLDEPPIISPFCSQPLAELCLRIPTFMNIRGGWDRATARRAFANDLPREIAWRSTKGSPDPWLKHVIDQNAEFVRSFLIDGMLVRQGLLDKRKLEAALPGVPTKAIVGGNMIMNLLYTESWIRLWPRIGNEAIRF